jgi:ParB-like chromosome segregation protein Spo0J
MKVKIDQIKLNPSDTKAYEGDPDQVKRVAKMARLLQKEGQLKPIKLNSDLTIVDGHTRFHAAKKLGWEEIDAVITDSANP